MINDNAAIDNIVCLIVLACFIRFIGVIAVVAGVVVGVSAGRGGEVAGVLMVLRAVSICAET